MNVKRIVAAALVCLSLLKFIQAAEGDAKPRIIDGTSVPVSQFPTVGLLTDAQDSFTCTGTLIAPRFFLTACHCVVDSKGRLILNPTDTRVKLGGKSFSAVKITPNSSYHGDSSQDVEGAVDLAVIELNQDVPGITPSPILRTAPTVGAILTLVGFGEQGTGATGGNNTFPADGIVNFGKTPIDIVTATFVKWNFDQVAAPNQESDTAPGDSGGPQFVSVNNVLTLCSVTSGGGEPKFGDLSYNTRVDIAAAWIDSILNGGVTVPGNNPPALVSLMASTQAPKPGATVTFTAAASDPDGDALTYAWAFGDGEQATTQTGTVNHVYAAAGMYTMQLVITDGRGGSVQGSLNMTVGIIEVLIAKKKFTLNFANANKDMLDFTLIDPRFAFASKFDFLDALEGAQVKVFIDDVQIDASSISGTKAIGKGTVTFTPKKGLVRYMVRSQPDLTTLFAKYGAVNDTIFSQVIVPVRIEIAGTRFGGDATFNYKAKLGKSGTGN